MLDFTKHFATRVRAMLTPQSEPVPGSGQVPNSAGGYAWAINQWDRLDRFLVLGSEGGTYYVGERKLTLENAHAVADCLAEDGPRVVARVVEMSESGRAPRNDPALFVLAMAAGLGDAPTRAAALAALPRVARTGTHLFHWLQFVRGFRGWGRGVRRAVAGWYTQKAPRELAYQLLKYPSRDGWSHRDALRLAHPQAGHGRAARAVRPGRRRRPACRWRARAMRWRWCARQTRCTRTRRSIRGRRRNVIRDNRLTREMVPTPLLAHPVVWEALLEEMPLTALIRNLATMTRVGLVAPGSSASRQVAERIADADALRQARVHPVQVLSALRTYASGRGRARKRDLDAGGRRWWTRWMRRSTWPLARCGRRNRRMMLALDVSGSMVARVLGMDHLSCREASAAMALVTAATEPEHFFTAFTAGSTRRCTRGSSTRAVGAVDQPAPAAGRRGAVHQRHPVRRDGLRPADGGGREEPVAGGRVRGLHGQRDLGGEHPPLAGAPPVPGADGDRREAGGRGDGVQRVQHRGPGGCGDAGRGGLRRRRAAADRRLRAVEGTDRNAGPCPSVGAGPIDPGT